VSSSSSKAAAALQAISLESPIKSTKRFSAAPVIDDARRSLSPVSETEKVEHEGVDPRKRFVGDLDLPESVLTYVVPSMSPCSPFL